MGISPGDSSGKWMQEMVEETGEKLTVWYQCDSG